MYHFNEGACYSTLCSLLKMHCLQNVQFSRREFVRVTLYCSFIIHLLFNVLLNLSFPVCRAGELHCSALSMLCLSCSRNPQSYIYFPIFSLLDKQWCPIYLFAWFTVEIGLFCCCFLFASKVMLCL